MLDDDGMKVGAVGCVGAVVFEVSRAGLDPQMCPGEADLAWHRFDLVREYENMCVDLLQ